MTILEIEKAIKKAITSQSQQPALQKTTSYPTMAGESIRGQYTSEEHGKEGINIHGCKDYASAIHHEP